MQLASFPRLPDHAATMPDLNDIRRAAFRSAIAQTIIESECQSRHVCGQPLSHWVGHRRDDVLRVVGVDGLEKVEAALKTIGTSLAD